MCYRNKEYNPHWGALTRHHKKPRSVGGVGRPFNISYVPEKLHRSYHALFANFCPEKIAEILNEHWIDGDYHMVAIQKCDMKEFIQCPRCRIWYKVSDGVCPNC